MTIHVVYVKGAGISTPAAMGRELCARLARRHEVQLHDYRKCYGICPRPGDILIGHPHPDPRTVFQRSVRQEGWERTILMMPFAHARRFVGTLAWADPLAARVDHVLGICARYWIDTLDASLVSHWGYKLRHLDLAVNREHFPFLKQTWSPRGARRFLYVGHTLPYKGTDYLSQLAEANPWLQVAWIGSGEMASPRIEALGMRDFSSAAARELVAGFDFLLTCGRSDANPTTILEAAAWGLVPVCTPQSGYYQEDWVVNIPLDEPAEAARILRELNDLDDAELTRRQAAGQRALAEHYTWDRFVADVEACLAAEPPAAPTAPAWRERAERNSAELKRIVAARECPWVQERVPGFWAKIRPGLAWRLRAPLRRWQRARADG